MPDERPTVWAAQPHTIAKHLILRRYFVAWLPIMLRRYRHVVYVDGFAGPGVYEGGEPGSPIIALQIVAEHTPLQTKPPEGSIDMFFIEERSDRFQRLQLEIAATLERSLLPRWARYDAYPGTFDQILLGVLNRFQQEAPPPPRLVFADPFGFSDIPMAVVKQAMVAPSSEFFVFFDYADIYRFLTDATKAATLDRLFLTQDWRQFIQEPDEGKQRDGLLSLYGTQLKKHASFNYVWPFTLVDSLKRYYFLVFGTRNKEGLRQMKAAYWDVDPERGRFFLDTTNPDQVALLPASSEVTQLPDILRGRFPRKWIRIEDVEDFVLGETDFSDEIHLKQRTLLQMEKALPRRIQVIGRKRDRPGEYPPGTMILFL